MDIMKMMGKARELQTKMAEMQEELKDVHATGESGAGAVKVTLDGKMTLTAIELDASLLKPEDKEIVEDLIIAASADAKAKVEELVQEKSQAMMGDMGLPAGFKLPF